MKNFPMPGTQWYWRGDPLSAPLPRGPKTVESLRWFAGEAEAIFTDNTAASVKALMEQDAWEQIA